MHVTESEVDNFIECSEYTYPSVSTDRLQMHSQLLVRHKCKKDKHSSGLELHRALKTQW